MSELTIRIVGSAGDGVISSGDILTLATARSERYVSTYRSFPTEIRGVDQSLYQLRISSEKIYTPDDRFDVLIAFNEKFLKQNIDYLNPGGIVIFDNSECDNKFEEHKGITKLFAPIKNLSNEFATERSKNMVALGVLLGLTPNLDIRDQIKSDIEKKYASKGQKIIKANIVAFDKAYDWARENLEKVEKLEALKIAQSGKKLVMSGCEAMALGALVAGCSFYSGYPITPATEIMEMLAEELPRLGGNVIQVEDEIAAITAALGASFAGAKSMTATSGPGLSLMIESLGLASMAELPVVIVDVQRGGPSTGLPTKTEQSDLNLAIYGAHGDAPKIVLAPINVEDSFFQTVKAFNYAEKYQVPVIILSDVSLGERRECIDLFDLKDIEIINRLKPKKLEEGEIFARYKYTDNGVSPMTTPGQKGGQHVATGLEHTEYSMPSSKPDIHIAMTEKRFRKLEVAQDEFLSAKTYGSDDAKIGIISWGSTSGPVIEAIDMAAQQGYNIQALYPRIIHPFPSEWINNFVPNKDILFIIERNYTGQLANTLYYRCSYMGNDLKIHQLRKYDGEPFSSRDIFEQIQGVLKSEYAEFAIKN